MVSLLVRYIAEEAASMGIWVTEELTRSFATWTDLTLSSWIVSRGVSRRLLSA